MTNCNFKTTINLSAMPGAVRAEINGVQGTFIPDGDCNVFTTERGGAYLSLVHWLSRIPDQKGNTHNVKISYPKGDERGTACPMLGTSRPMMPKQQMQQMPYQQIPPIPGQR